MNKPHSNPDELFMSVRYEQTDTKEIKKDLAISTPKISFLQSDKSIQSIDKLLDSLKDLVPKF